jgi:hypothetical protein
MINFKKMVKRYQKYEKEYNTIITGERGVRYLRAKEDDISKQLKNQCIYLYEKENILREKDSEKFLWQEKGDIFLIELSGYPNSGLKNNPTYKRTLEIQTMSESELPEKLSNLLQEREFKKIK